MEKADLSFLKDPDNVQTQTYLQKKNRQYKRFFKRHKEAKHLKEAIKRLQTKSEDGCIWTDSDDISYQFVFPRNAEYEVLNRNNVVGFDFNSLMDQDDRDASDEEEEELFLGDIEPYQNHAVFGWNRTGDAWFDAHIYNFVSCRFYNEVIAFTDHYAWAADGLSFFYVSVEPVKNWPNKVFMHVLGSPVSEDLLIYEELDSRFVVEVVRSPSYLFVGSEEPEKTTEWRVYDAVNPLAKKPLLLGERKSGLEYYPDEIHGGDFCIKTNDGGQSPDFRLVLASRASPLDWSKEVIGHVAGRMLDDVAIFAKHLAIETVQDAVPGLLIVELEGSKRTHMVDIGVAQPYCVNLEKNCIVNSSVVRYSISSPLLPEQVIQYDMEKGEKIVLHEMRIHRSFDPSLYESELLRVPSRDGHSVIPVTLVYKRDDAPRKLVVLSGYQAYAEVDSPSFSYSTIALLNHGGAYAFCHGRGSSSLGREWHNDGRMLNKKNSMHDFCDAAKFLRAKQGFTDVVASGASAGGLLVLSSILMEPTLFSGCIARVPFCQILDDMMDPALPLTEQEYNEWGNPLESDEIREYIASYSPYDNVKSGQRYPPTLLSGAIADRQVMYHEPAMMARRLKAANRRNKVLLDIAMNQGHQGSQERTGSLKEISQDWAFALYCVGRRIN